MGYEEGAKRVICCDPSGLSVCPLPIPHSLGRQVHRARSCHRRLQQGAPRRVLRRPVPHQQGIRRPALPPRHQDRSLLCCRHCVCFPRGPPCLAVMPTPRTFMSPASSPSTAPTATSPPSPTAASTSTPSSPSSTSSSPSSGSSPATSTATISWVSSTPSSYLPRPPPHP